MELVLVDGMPFRRSRTMTNHVSTISAFQGGGSDRSFVRKGRSSVVGWFSRIFAASARTVKRNLPIDPIGSITPSLVAVARSVACHVSTFGKHCFCSDETPTDE